MCKKPGSIPLRSPMQSPGPGISLLHPTVLALLQAQKWLPALGAGLLGCARVCTPRAEVPLRQPPRSRLLTRRAGEVWGNWRGSAGEMEGKCRGMQHLAISIFSTQKAIFLPETSPVNKSEWASRKGHQCTDTLTLGVTTACQPSNTHVSTTFWTLLLL